MERNILGPVLPGYSLGSGSSPRKLKAAILSGGRKVGPMKIRKQQEESIEAASSAVDASASQTPAVVPIQTQQTDKTEIAQTIEEGASADLKRDDKGGHQNGFLAPINNMLDNVGGIFRGRRGRQRWTTTSFEPNCQRCSEL